ncbi:helix-turn-helix transcriptional regulator [Aeromonas sp. 31P]
MNGQATNEQLNKVPKIMTREEVTKATTLSRSTMYQMISDGHFPKPIKLTAGRTAWLESDIAAWINSRISASR